MSSTALSTIVKMLESLPDEVQEQVAEHLQEYIEDLQDEIKWNESFQKTQLKLIAVAKRVKQEIAEGKASEMNYNKL
jgi:hypothetical protein